MNLHLIVMQLNIVTHASAECASGIVNDR
jgi:hypothetical protein